MWQNVTWNEEPNGQSGRDGWIAGAGDMHNEHTYNIYIYCIYIYIYIYRYIYIERERGRYNIYVGRLSRPHCDLTEMMVS